MPKKIDGYQCEKCLHVCDSLEAAQTCEKYHGESLEFSVEFERSKAGPSEIRCTFTKVNGERITKTYY